MPALRHQPGNKTDGVITKAEQETYSTIPEGGDSGFPSQLYVYKEGTDELVWEEFLDKVESVSIETVPLDGAQKMNFTQPEHVESFPYAVLVSDIIYTSACETNEIWWTLKMKNGDTIRLQHNVNVSTMDAVCYYPEDVPMDTTEDLLALLDTIEAEVDPETVVYLYLPPVTYEGDVSLGNHTYIIYGGTDGNNQTTFTGTWKTNAENYQFSEIYEVHFAGNGGTGLSARSCVILVGCTFENNKIGLEMNTNHADSSDPYYSNNIFVDNEIGFRLTNVFSTEVFHFSGCTFSGNGTDIENLIDQPVDTSGAVFE